MLYISRNGRFPNPDGMVPSKRLCAARITLIFVRLYKEAGISPLNLLKHTLKTKSFGSVYPMLLGN